MENKDQKGSVNQPKSELFERLTGLLYPTQKELEEIEVSGWENQTLAEARAIHDRNCDNEEVSILIHSQE